MNQYVKVGELHLDRYEFKWMIWYILIVNENILNFVIIVYKWISTLIFENLSW